MEETDNICFVCDQTIPLEKWKYQLQVTATKSRNAPVADLIQELVGEEFEVLVGERDAICSRCMNLLNQMDSLTVQLGEVRCTLSQLLHAKYNLTAEETQLQVEYDDSTHIEREPLHQCDICNYQTKYEKEFIMHLRRHPAPKSPKSPLAVKPEVVKRDNSIGKHSVSTPKMPSSKITNKTKSKSPKKKPPKKSPRRKKTPKQKTKNVSKVSRGKKKKVVFQCSVCNQVFPDENAIRLHCKLDHGNDKIVVSDEEEYDDIQTLESSDSEILIPKKEVKKKRTKKAKASTKKNLDFLDDWIEDEDNDDFHSPPKKIKLEKSENETIQTKQATMKNLFRSSLRESSDDVDDDDMDEKDASSQPTCVFCQAKFSSFEAVQDHVKLSHGSMNVPKPNTGTPASVASFEIDSTTDIAESKKQVSVQKQKPKAKSYKCTLCGIRKVSLNFIKEHVKRHKRIISLQCKKCGIVFKKVISLKVHSYKCRRVSSLLKKCKQCKFRFVNSVQLKNHIKKVHQKQYTKKQEISKFKKSSNVDRKNINPDGNFNVTKSTQLNRNNSVKKSVKTDNSKISVSEVSSTSVETEVKLKQKGLSQTQYHCSECNLDFPQFNRFQTHRLRHTAHTCNNLGICVFCEKLFLSAVHLTIHNKTVHEVIHNTKPKCAVAGCNKEYSLMKDLKLHHIRCHFSEGDKFIKQVSELKNKDSASKSKVNDENDVYNKVFKELQDLTGEGNDSEDLTINEGISPLSYNCPVCDFTSEDDKEVKTHLPSHVQHYCNICENIFRPDEVINHLENHSIDFQGLKCTFCDRECHDDIHRQFHTQSSHSESKQSLPIHRQFQCNMCEKTCFAEKSLLSHKASQHGEKAKKALSCYECKSDFFSEKTYQTHVEFAHRPGLNCKYCDKSLENLKKLIFHEKNHLKEAKSIIKCNICGKVLKSKQALKAHRSLHSSNSTHCEVCNKSFKSYHSLREHSAKHSGLQEKKYFCEICRKGFYFYDSHTRHRRLHLDPLLFQCKNCKERFQTKLKLIEHKKTCNVNLSKGS